MCKTWVNIFQFCSVTQVKCIVHKPFEIKYEIDHDEHAERDFFFFKNLTRVMAFTANGQTLRLGSLEEHSNAQNGRKPSIFASESRQIQDR